MNTIMHISWYGVKWSIKYPNIMPTSKEEIKNQQTETVFYPWITLSKITPYILI